MSTIVEGSDSAGPSQPSSPPPLDEAERAARARGRKVALVSYFSLIVVVAAVGGAQVIYQGLRPTPPAPPGSPPAPTSCADGVRQLRASLDRGRARAAEQHDGEAALTAFRTETSREWLAIANVEAVCRSADERALLDAAVLLRAQEELAARRDADGVLPARRELDRRLGR